MHVIKLSSRKVYPSHTVQKTVDRNHFYCLWVPAGSPSRGGDVTVYIYDMNHPSLPTPFYSVHVSIFVFMALSSAFHSTNSPYNSPFFRSVLPVLSLPNWSFQL